MNHEEMIEAVNSAKTEYEHSKAIARLDGWRIASEHFGQKWSGVSADLYTMSKYGEDAPMCCGVLLNWKATA